jgi:CBS domain containing-hemolysin-like protein
VSGGLGLLLAAMLIVANGLFVAAEFSLVSVRRPVVDERAAGGDRRARTVTRELSRLSFALSAAQFGITLSSLLLGYIAERAVGDTLIRPLLDLVGIPEEAALGVTLTGAFLLSTVVQMVVGELFPKNLAISRPLGVSLTAGPFNRGFGLLLGPVIKVFHRAAEAITRRAFRVELTDELEGGHTLDELARIISASGEEGSLTSEQTELLQRALELGDTRVSEVMVPRPDVVWLQRDATLVDLRAEARRTGHSRFPVRGDSEDDLLGTIHVKDLLSIPLDAHPATPVTAAMFPPLVVPESETLRRLLSDLRREQRTFAVVIDEYGGTAGIVTLEDVLEELVGEIEDEFDRHSSVVRRIGAGRYLLHASLRTDRLADLLEVELPEGEYETVAGFLLAELGRIPEGGEVVRHDGWELEVAAVDGVRITEVVLRRLPVTEPTGEEA